MIWLSMILVIVLLVSLQYKSKKSRLGDKIKKYVNENPDMNLTVLAANIANNEEFNSIPFDVAEEYCYLIESGKSVEHLDDEYDHKRVKEQIHD